MLICCHSALNSLFKSRNAFNCYKFYWRFSKKLENLSPNIKYCLVLDFEATCDANSKITQEIIEFPCLKLNAQTFRVESIFHEYVRPVIVPELPLFCIELTGILQEMVDSSDPFPMVFKRFEKWKLENDLTESNSIFVTSGDWDLGKMLPLQCQLSDVSLTTHYLSWIDLKKLFCRQTGFLPKSLIEMIRKCGLQFQGRQHSGIDDCINIANVIRSICEGKHLDLRPTSVLRKSPLTSTGFKVLTTPYS